MGDSDELRIRHSGTDGEQLAQMVLPMVEIYETIEGEGSRAGFSTVFVRVFGCNLRCVWCDTPYSYAPAKAEQFWSIEEIVSKVNTYTAKHLCLTGGEPLMYGEKSLALLQHLARLPQFEDIHVETNGAIDLAPFLSQLNAPHVRYIMDYKLHGSAEHGQMLQSNIHVLREQDEIKFVIANEEDFLQAKTILLSQKCSATPLFSPVWESMPPAKLASLIIEHGLANVRLSLQIHKLIWSVDQRGV